MSDTRYMRYYPQRPPKAKTDWGPAIFVILVLIAIQLVIILVIAVKVYQFYAGLAEGLSSIGD